MYGHADCHEGSQSGQESQSDDDLDEYDPLPPVELEAQARAGHLDAPRGLPASQSMAPSGADIAGVLQQAHGSTLRQVQDIMFSEPQMMNTSGGEGIRPQALSGLSHTLRTSEHSSSWSSVMNISSLFSDMHMQPFAASVVGDSPAPRAIMPGQHQHSTRLVQQRWGAGVQPSHLPMPQEMSSSSVDGPYRSRAPLVNDAEAPEYAWSGVASYRSCMAGMASTLATIEEESGESDNESEGSHNGDASSSPLHLQEAGDHNSLLHPDGEISLGQNSAPFSQYKDDHGIQKVVACLTGMDDQPATEAFAAASGDGTDSETRAAFSGCLSLASLQNFVERKEKQFGSVHQLMQAHDVSAGPALGRSETGRSSERPSTRYVLLSSSIHIVSI